MLKFRLPWDLSQYTQYLDGRIQLPIYGRRLTHESRLITHMEAPEAYDASLITRMGATDVLYDNGRYERQMAHFNQFVRNATYEGGRCYDCTAFRRVIADFLGDGNRLQVE